MAQWLEWNRGYTFPRGLKDMVDFVQHRVEDGCGRTVPQAILSALSLLEQVGRVPFDAEGPTKETGRDLSLELTVVESSEPLYSRALAWVVLCMVWGAMRCDDVQAVLPHRSILSNYGLRFVLGKERGFSPHLEDYFTLWRGLAEMWARAVE